MINFTKSTFLLLFAISLFFLSCTKDPVPQQPEIVIPEGLEEIVIADNSTEPTKLSFTTNEPWNITIGDGELKSDNSWLSVQPMSGSAGTANVTVIAQKNETYNARAAKIKINLGTISKSINVYQKPIGSLTLTPSTFSVDMKGGNVEIVLKTNLKYTVSVKVPWITEVKSKGIEEYRLNFAVAANEGYDGREGQIVITDTDNQFTETITVTQNQKDAIVLGEKTKVATEEGGEIEAIINSNIDYEVQMPEGVEWVKRKETKGLVESKVVFVVSPNNEYTTRECQIKFTNLKSGINDVLTIQQYQKDAIIISKKEVEINDTKQTLTVELKTNVDFTYKISEDAQSWIKPIVTKGLRNEEVSFEILANETYDARIGTIEFTNTKNNIKESVTINQTQKNTIISKVKEYNLGGDQQNLSVTMSSNVDIEVLMPSEVDWITLAPQSKALTDKTFDFIVSENKKDLRSAKIVFKNTKTNVSDTITVKQYVGKITAFELKDGETIEDHVSLDEGKSIETAIISGRILEKKDFDDINFFMYKLKHLDISGVKNTEIPDKSFKNSTISILILPSNLTEIGDSAFSGCSSLTTIDIPERMIEIGGGAFSGCSSLTTIDIPERVTRIGRSAFSECSSLTTIKIPEGVTEIGYYAFSGCSSLTSINIPEGVTEIGGSAFEGCSSLTSINIPEGVTEIGDSAFRDCSSLTTIKVPDGVTEIGRFVFAVCSSLTTIKIPEGVTEIGSSAFSDCSSLTTINIPDEVTVIGDYAFSDCSSLTTIDIPEGVTEIVRNTFSGCSSLTTINIPDGVTEIGDRAFSYCSSLTTINIPDEVTVIGDYAFSNCNSLTSINISEGVTVIGDRAFSYCRSLITINIPDGVTEIGDRAFSYCSFLKTINIPEGVTVIGESTFLHCSSLTTINIPEGVTVIGDSAFSYCRSLKTINIPEGVTVIGESTFLHCSSLTTINIPEGVTVIGSSAFSYCSSLTTINIPEGVTEIGDSAFSGCSYLTTINIPEGVTKIEGQVFSDCSSLTTINIPEGVTEIGSGAFSGCRSLTTINIPDGVTEIGRFVFAVCSSLTTINIPEGVTVIGDSAFEGCSSLAKITSLSKTPPVCEETDGNYNQFHYTHPYMKIYVPVASIDDYKAAKGWSTYKDRITAIVE